MPLTMPMTTMMITVTTVTVTLIKQPKFFKKSKFPIVFDIVSHSLRAVTAEKLRYN